MMSISFLNAILATIDSATWMLQQGKFFQPTFCMLYKYLAIYTRIQGLYNVPVECRRSQRPLRKSIDAARKYFQLMHPDNRPPNNKVLEKLFTHFLISLKIFGRLSTLFQGLLRNLGSSVSGDEKLFLSFFWQFLLYHACTF